MTKPTAAGKKEKTVGENIMVIILLLVFMGTAVQYFLKQQQHFTESGLNTLKSTFSARLMVMHAQWLMDKKPRVLKVKQHQGSETLYLDIPVNKGGWTDVGNTAFSCEQIWIFVMQTPLVFMKNPVAAIQINRNNTGHGRTCRYRLTSGQSFDYSSRNGKVE
jgi:hypothetical protein